MKSFKENLPFCVTPYLFFRPPSPILGLCFVYEEDFEVFFLVTY